MNPRSLVMVTVGAFAVSSWASPVRAQNQGTQIEQLNRAMKQIEQETQLLANPALTIGERAVVEYGGLVTFAFMAIDDIEQSTHILRNTDSQVFGRVSIDGAHEFFGRLRFNYFDYNAGDDFDGLGDELEYAYGDRWWYRFDLRRAIQASEGVTPDYNVALQVGRQWVEVGSGIVLSEQLYAVTGALEFGPILIEPIAGRTPGSSVIDFDSSRPDFDADTDRGFYGGKISWTGFENHTPYFFGLAQEDDNNDSATLSVGLGRGVTLAVPTTFGYDSYYLGIGSTGVIVDRLLYAAEFVYQGGSSLSSPLQANEPLVVPQTKDDISAWAANFELAYLVRDVNQTRFELQLLLASGDDDRLFETSNTVGGNKRNTDDNAFNAFGFSKTGLAFAAPISNLIMLRGGASTFPLPETRMFRDLQIGVDLFLFSKMDRDAPIDEPVTDDMFLGFETDLFLAWRVTSDFAVNVRYGVFFPGEAIVEDGDPRNFFYAGVSYSF